MSHFGNDDVLSGTHVGRLERRWSSEIEERLSRRLGCGGRSDVRRIDQRPIGAHVAEVGTRCDAFEQGRRDLVAFLVKQHYETAESNDAVAVVLRFKELGEIA